MSSETNRYDSEAKAALLLVHGYNGDPGDMQELDEHLAARGFVTRNLSLPGHGTTARDLAHAGWADWSGAVRQASLELLGSGLPVVLVGHSMGAALVLHEAATNDRIAAVAALCPPLRMHPGEVRAAALTRFVLPYLPTLWEDICDREARIRYPRRSYRWTSLAAAHSLFSALPTLRQQLAHIRCPALIVAARHDHVVPMRDGIEAYRLLGSAEKALVVLERSYHVVTKDLERHQVFEHVMTLAQRAAEQHSEPRPNRASPEAQPVRSEALTAAVAERRIRLGRRLAGFRGVRLADVLRSGIAVFGPGAHGVLQSQPRIDPRSR